MYKHLYANYSLSDFSKFDCLKLSRWIYLLLLFVCRGYVTWIISISNMQNRTDTIAFIYPDPNLFYLSLLSGALGLFVILIISLRKPETYSWVKVAWKHIRKILIFALLFDISVTFVGHFYFQLLSVEWLVIQTFITLVLIVLLYTQKRIKLNILEFPEKLIE